MTKNKIGSIRAIIEIVILLAAVIVGGILAGLTPPAIIAYGAMPILITAGFQVLVATILIYFARQTWRELGLFGRGSLSRTLAIAIGLAAIILIVVYGLGLRALREIGLDPLDISFFTTSLEGNTYPYVAFMILVVWGAAAIGEEMIARGFVMNRFEAVFSRLPVAPTLAALTQAALFGLAHSYQGLTGGILAGVTGLIFAASYYLSKRNLLLVILAHGLVDSVLITAIYLGHSEAIFI